MEKKFGIVFHIMLNHTGCDNGNLLWRLHPCSCAKCANSQKKGNLGNFVLTPALICLDPLLSHGGEEKENIAPWKFIFIFIWVVFPSSLFLVRIFLAFLPLLFGCDEKMKLENNSCPRNNWNKRISYSVPSTGVFGGRCDDSKALRDDLHENCSFRVPVAEKMRN